MVTVFATKCIKPGLCTQRQKRVNIHVTLQDFSPDLQNIYADISSASVTLCNSARDGDDHKHSGIMSNRVMTSRSTFRSIETQ